MKGILNQSFELEIESSHEVFKFESEKEYDIVHVFNNIEFNSGVGYVIFNNLTGDSMSVDSGHVTLV